MKDRHNRAQSMDRNHSRRRGGYDREMDHAFTLIFHNIKRLQDGQLSKSESMLARDDLCSSAAEITSVNSLRLPLRRDLSRSDPSLRVSQENTRKRTEAPDLLRPNSHSLCNALVSPQPQRRRVRFLDDSATAEGPKRQTLERRSYSHDRHLSVPLIILTKEGWNFPFHEHAIKT